MTKLKLTLRDKNDDKVTYEQDKVPARKVLEFWDLQAKLESGEAYSPKDYLMDRIEFCASLFSAKKVTAKTILDGLNAWELEETVDDIILTAIGVRKEEDPKLQELARQMVEKDSSN